ncbi:MAG: glycosyl hydrolase family 28-related protein, partial [Thermodesulfobacteriota bacterium]
MPDLTLAELTALEKGMVNVKALGLIGNGTTDDTAALNVIIDSYEGSGANSGKPFCLYFPPGVYKLTARIDISRDVSIVGSGSSATEIRWGAADADTPAGFKFTGSPININGLTLTTMSVPTTAGVQTAIEYDLTSEISSTTTKIANREQSRGLINDVVMRGFWDTDPTKNSRAWRNGIVLKNVMHFVVSKINFVGLNQTTGSGIVSNEAIRVEGTGAPVELHFTDIWAFDCQKGINIIGNTEGLRIERGVLVNVIQGIYINLSPQNRPQHAIVNTHINALSNPITIVGSSSPSIINCELYYKSNATYSASSGVGIQLSDCTGGHISNNKLAIIGSSDFNAIVLSGVTT